MSPVVFALVDCNKFYASCERLFQPDLPGKPIVILSNSDGCSGVLAIAWATKLKALGLQAAQDLARADPQWLRQKFNVTLERTAVELRGCRVSSWINSQLRSFGRPVRSLDELHQALALFAARAAEKLRRQPHRCYCRTVAVSISAGVHTAGRRHFARQAFIPLAATRDLSTAALKGRRQIYRPGHDYAKASVQLLDLFGPGKIQYGLFEPGPRARSELHRKPREDFSCAQRQTPDWLSLVGGLG